MRSTIAVRTAVALGGLAAALSLSACDGITINFGEDEGSTPAAQTTEDPGTSGDTDTTETAPAQDPGTDTDGGTGTGGTGTDGGTDTDGGAGTDTGTDGGGAGDGTSEQTADFTIDHNGNGKIPQDTLERDIADAYAEQGTSVSSVDCVGGLSIFHYTGSQSCTVTAGGQEHYGLVKVTNVEGQNVYYELEF
ncbi:MAG TPA: hypothetical protein H9793_04680 [Candidatus Brevibacterium intestinigallinarum]|nr:hypothetical protein [Candidatus Brevibacterium intestinigallinarum]